MFSSTAKKIFEKFDLSLCSNSETKNHLEKLNAKNVFYQGNIKLISDVKEKDIQNINEKILLKKRFWFAASTHKGEDITCLKTHQKLKEKFKDILTIIAPRHIERSKEINSLCKKLNLSSQILEENEKIIDNKEVVIINYFGALNDYFKYSKSVFIGKSMLAKLKNNGGQNPIEAAKLNCKIYHGPYVYNFKDIYEMLEKNCISNEISNYEELSKNLINDLDDPYKQSHNIIDPIKNLEQKTFIDTMKLVNEFVKNDAG